MALRTRGGLAAAVALMAACGGGGGGTEPPPPPPSTITIHLLAQSFSPAVDTVAAGANTVTWVWDSDGHNVHSFGASQFLGDTTTFNQPHTLAQTIPVAGTYHYFCSQHGTQLCNGGDMCGVVVVR